MFDLKELSGMVNADGRKAYVMLIVDHFTKFRWAVLMWGKDANAIAQYLFEVFSAEGVPERWHCDNGSEFLNGMMAIARGLLSLGNKDGLLPYTHGGVRSSSFMFLTLPIRHYQPNPFMPLITSHYIITVFRTNLTHITYI
jgi:hypothetical protein